MAYFEGNRGRAAALILLLGLGLAIALAPYVTGLLGGVVLFVVFHPIFNWMAPRLGRGPAAGLVVLLVLVVIIVPGVVLTGVVVDQAQSVAAEISGWQFLSSVEKLRIGPFDIGAELARSTQEIGHWLGRNAIGFLGTLTRISVNIVISLFVVYYLLLEPGQAWELVSRNTPFSAANTLILKERFLAITYSTLIGTGLIALAQGTLLAFGFFVTGLPGPVFWGVVTVVLAILPVVGTGMVWVPAAGYLAYTGRFGAAVFLTALGVVVIGNADLAIRPAIFRRYASVHPLVTVVGVLGGITYFGLLGLLVGPLAISYFFELLQMYREEFSGPAGHAAA
jgi:predicted PurR-regulated permease PerM